MELARKEVLEGIEEESDFKLTDQRRLILGEPVKNPR